METKRSEKYVHVHTMVARNKYNAFTLISEHSFTEFLNLAIDEFLSENKDKLSKALNRKIFWHLKYPNYGADELGNIYKKPFILQRSKRSNGYRKILIGNKNYLAHRFVFECVNNTLLKDNEVIDHINKDTLENKITNLQQLNPTTHNQKHKMLDAKHIKHKKRLNLYQVKIWNQNLGYFHTEREASIHLDNFYEDKRGIRPNSTKRSKACPISQEEYEKIYFERMGYPLYVPIKSF